MIKKRNIKITIMFLVILVVLVFGFLVVRMVSQTQNSFDPNSRASEPKDIYNPIDQKKALQDKMNQQSKGFQVVKDAINSKSTTTKTQIKNIK